METIEKLTGNGDIQIFELITNRKELTEWLKETLFDEVYSDYATCIYSNEDIVTMYSTKDGESFYISKGEEVKRPNISKIDSLVQHNGVTTVLYGNVRIVYNEYYGDYEVI